MKLKTPLDKARITTHFQYNIWKYVLVVVLAIFVWDLVYAYTAYRPPEDKRIDIYAQSAYSTHEEALAYLDELRERAVPDVELVTFAALLNSGENDMYAAQQLTTYIAAREGDLFFLNSADFKRFASQGVFVELEPFVDDKTLQLDGIDLSSGYIAMQEYDEESQTMRAISKQQLYGISAAELIGFPSKMGVDQRDLFLAMTIYNGNDEQVLTYLNALIQDMRTALPAQQEVSP